MSVIAPPPVQNGAVPTVAPDGAATHPARSRPDDVAGTDGHSLTDDLIATLALLAFSLAVAAGFARVFSGWAFFDNLAVVAIVGHGLSLTLRRLRVPVLLAFPLLIAVTAWLIGAMFYRSTYALGLPTSETWELFRLELELVSEQFRTAVAPVAFLGGWDVLAAIGMGAVVILSDTFAFRAYARAEALVPGGVLFVFVAALGNDRDRVALTVLLVATGVLTTAVLRAHHAPRRATSIGPTRRTVAWVLPAAVVTALAVGLLAGAVGPKLPGADAEPLYETKGGNRGSVTELTSPLVDIRSRLTNQGVRELFVVQADADAYWRSSALPQFDGTIWGLPERSLDDTDGDLQTALPGSVQIRQSITIAALGGSFVPAAADPIQAGGSEDLRFNADTASLIKLGDGLVTGDQFEVVSAAPRYSAAQLSTATSTDPGDPIYFELPSNFPPSIAETTRAVIGEGATPYEAARRLQDWMQSEFTYSLEVQEGHGNNAIETFLRDRVGYCEQFAGSYAAMMRSVGYPARVAVGFTPGIDDGTGRYSVRGRNAHAWPEVWFDGLGWVPFEPTPGRGAPGAADYTGLAPDQEDGPIEPGTGDGEAAPTPTVTTPAPTIPGGETTPTTVPNLAPTFPDQLDAVDGDGETAAAPDDGSSPWPFVLIGLAILAALAAPAVVRRVRRRPHRDPDVEIQRLWTRATHAVESAGVDVRASQTPLETAERTTIVFPTASRPMNALADAVSEAVYGAAGTESLTRDGTYGTNVIGNCSVWCRQIEKAVADSASPQDRFRHYFTSWT